MESLKAKLLVLLGIFVLVSGGIVAKTFSTISDQENDSKILDVAGKQRMLIQKMMKEFNMVMNDTGEDETAFEKIKADLQNTTEIFGNTLKGLIHGDKELGLASATLKDFKDQLLKVNEIWLKFAEVFARGFKGGFFDEEQNFFNENETLLLTEMGKAADIFARASKDKVLLLKKIQVVYLVFILIGLVLLLLWFKRQILTPIGNVTHMIHELGEGHLDQRLKMNKSDEIGRMADVIDTFADNLENEVLAAFQKLSEGNFTFEAKGVIKNPLEKTNESLNEIMAQINQAGEHIASSSTQISGASQSLSQGSSEQVSSLEEITRSMEKMGSQTKHNAENATNANQLVASAREIAEKGNVQMDEIVKAMLTINDSSKSISKIMKVIDEISFQTNLLALNAAVEAARAGKHGKGFAVVAEEVRNLAARSAKAAKETTEMIESSIKKTTHGSEIAKKGDEALAEIVAVVTKVADLVGEIAAASNEQAEGIAQVNQSLGQIKKVTQQNAANAEESAAASEGLSTQAIQLKEMLTHFKLKGQEVTEIEAKKQTEKAIMPAESPLADEVSDEKFYDDGNDPIQRKETRILKPSDIIFLNEEEIEKF